MLRAFAIPHLATEKRMGCWALARWAYSTAIYASCQLKHRGGGGMPHPIPTHPTWPLAAAFPLRRQRAHSDRCACLRAEDTPPS